MTNETIYGCVNRTTGEVEFVQDTACTYTGTICRTGANAGQIAVTINTLNCDDVYYSSCVNRSTGKFQVSVPSTCCTAESCTCSYGNAFPECFDANKTPSKVFVKLSDVNICAGFENAGPWSLNGQWICCTLTDAGVEHPRYSASVDDGTYNFIVTWYPIGDPVSYTPGVWVHEIEGPWDFFIPESLGDHGIPVWDGDPPPPFCLTTDPNWCNCSGEMGYGGTSHVSFFACT